MPRAPNRPCLRYGCNAVTRNPDGYCDNCQDYAAKKKKRSNRKVYTDNRPSYRQRGYSTQWDKVRKLKAKRDPLCERCLSLGRVTPVEIVHHIKSVRKYPELKLVMSNLMSVCRPCHVAVEGEDDGQQ